MLRASLYPRRSAARRTSEARKSQNLANMETFGDLTPGDRGDNHLKRCHLANPGEIYAVEVLPEIAPDLIDPETGEMIPELAAVDPDEV